MKKLTQKEIQFNNEWGKLYQVYPNAMNSIFSKGFDSYVESRTKGFYSFCAIEQNCKLSGL